MSVLGDLYVKGVRCTPADGGFVSVERDPRGVECKHGIAGALEDGAICSGCVAERNAGQGVSVTDDLGDLILDPVDVQITPVDLAKRDLSIGFTATLDVPLAERIATIPREHGEAWGDYAARRGYPRSDYPPGKLGTSEWHEHLAWLAGEDEPDQG